MVRGEKETIEDTTTTPQAAEEDDHGKEAGGMPPPQAGQDFEVRKHRVGRKPVLPTKAEID